MIVRKTVLAWSQIEEIHRLFTALKNAGKKIVVYLESADNRTYYLAAAADRVLLPPPATLELVGLRSEILYFKNLLSFLGIEPQLFNIGKFKSAAEIFQRDRMSQASREMADSILSDMQGRMLSEIAEHRRVSRVRVREWVDNGPYTARRALSEGLVDELAYEDELPLILERWFPQIRRQMVRHREGLMRRILTFYRPQIALT